MTWRFGIPGISTSPRRSSNGREARDDPMLPFPALVTNSITPVGSRQLRKRNTPAFDVADGSSHRYASAMDGGAVKAPRGLEPASRLRVEPSFLQKDRHRRCLQM